MKKTMYGSQNNINILKPPDIPISQHHKTNQHERNCRGNNHVHQPIFSLLRMLSSSRVARNSTKPLGAVILIEALSIGHLHAHLQRHGLMMARLHQWYYASRWFGLAVSFDRDAWAQGG
ncbi:protein of unknown function [Acidithiobacillus ferrivorans]|uniref:Transposase n=1 Tax=Acidithiobacillus ferrivorans TaxID=160808 RepID=A0ABY1MR84_9PROT|nr:protein of unknown function [Acidithiobacillus ferrivorans]